MEVQDQVGTFKQFCLTEVIFFYPKQFRNLGILTGLFQVLNKRMKAPRSKSAGRDCHLPKVLIPAVKEVK